MDLLKYTSPVHNLQLRDHMLTLSPSSTLNPRRALNSRPELTDDEIIKFMKAYVFACGDLVGIGSNVRKQAVFNDDYILYRIELDHKENLSVRSLLTNTSQSIRVDENGMFNPSSTNEQRAMYKLRICATTASRTSAKDVVAFHAK